MIRILCIFHSMEWPHLRLLTSWTQHKRKIGMDLVAGYRHYLQHTSSDYTMYYKISSHGTKHNMKGGLRHLVSHLHFFCSSLRVQVGKVDWKQILLFTSRKLPK